ncbi:hypothetical protein DEU56DRAFT_902511 [Suillus clintonianus]|uniref:uncharacterized protein n=1 Tax=Suillus clintonianus TaxID=1904413 RepID=UPI001B87311D|nr:uncharacterized protein DEU56DRAFT_902511 [Suillus clintonianus]KAG2131349.1 hypothetical protein DEU56DRAFT_902511 [Suillus clintonianus]
MASDQSIETDVQYVITRKRKRPAYDSQDEEALDSLHFKSSMDIREPSLGLVPPIVNLAPTRNTTAAKLNRNQEAVSVDKFIRQVITEVPGPQRKRKLRTVQLDTSISSTGGANIQPVTPPARAKVYASNGGRISKKPVGARKPMTLTQRLARAAMLSHVETNEILDSLAISSRRPLDFVPFQKFATPPCSPKKTLVNQSTSSGVGSSSGARRPSEVSAAMIRGNRCQAKKKHTSERPDCPPLNFVPEHEARAAYTAMFPHNRRKQKPKPKKPTTERPDCPPLTFVPEHEAKAAYAIMFPPNRRRQKPKPKKPTSERPDCPPLTFVPEHEAKAAYAAMFPPNRRKQKPKSNPNPTTERPDCPPLTFVPEHEAKAASAVMFPRRQKQKTKHTTERPDCPPLTFVPEHEAKAAYAAMFPYTSPTDVGKHNNLLHNLLHNLPHVKRRPYILTNSPPLVDTSDSPMLDRTEPFDELLRRPQQTQLLGQTIHSQFTNYSTYFVITRLSDVQFLLLSKTTQ